MADSIDCREAKDRLQDYLKRELTPALALEVRAHLERCRSCFRHSRFEERFLLMLEEHARRGTCPGAVRERILQALRAEAERG
jgi:anti-sigma factor (TIGR02949 family)